RNRCAVSTNQFRGSGDVRTGLRHSQGMKPLVRRAAVAIVFGALLIELSGCGGSGAEQSATGGAAGTASRGGNGGMSDGGGSSGTAGASGIAGSSGSSGGPGFAGSDGGAGAGGVGASGGRGGAAGGSGVVPFWMGADVTDQEPQPDATRANLLTIMKQYGFNAIRLRTFVDPKAADGYDKQNGYADVAHTVAFGKQIVDAGMAL